VELRQDQRYRLSTPVIFSVHCADLRSDFRDGRTRDISRSGVFVLTSEELPESTLVYLEIMLPSSYPESSGARLRSRGHVVRSEHDGFAVSADVPFRISADHTDESNGTIKRSVREYSTSTLSIFERK